MSPEAVAVVDVVQALQREYSERVIGKLTPAKRRGWRLVENGILWGVGIAFVVRMFVVPKVNVDLGWLFAVENYIVACVIIALVLAQLSRTVNVWAAMGNWAKRTLGKGSLPQYSDFAPRAEDQYVAQRLLEIKTVDEIKAMVAALEQDDQRRGLIWTNPWLQPCWLAMIKAGIK